MKHPEVCNGTTFQQGTLDETLGSCTEPLTEPANCVQKGTNQDDLDAFQCNLPGVNPTTDLDDISAWTCYNTNDCRRECLDETGETIPGAVWYDSGFWTDYPYTALYEDGLKFNPF